jgi:hypothetical protein
LATHLRALRVEPSLANAVAQRKTQTPAALVPVRVQTSNLAKMVVAVAQRTAQTTHLAQAAQQMASASHVTTLTTAHVARHLAKPAMVAQTMVVTGLLVRTSQKAVAANAVAVLLVAMTVARAATSLAVATVLLAVTLVTATTVAHAATQTAVHHAANGLQSVQLVAH